MHASPPQLAYHYLTMLSQLHRLFRVDWEDIGKKQSIQVTAPPFGNQSERTHKYT
jgi:hypothetical protein